MKHIICACLGLFILMSCSPRDTNEGDFKLLPLPKKFEIQGVSALSANAIQRYFTTGKTPFPMVGAPLAHLKPTKDAQSAQVVYEIDTTLDIRAEGYVMTITDEQITLSGKDKAGLFYGFKTVEQLLVDAQEQGANLPLCTIEDYPLLSYRAIHWDVKHHLEKTEYYYELIDRLSGYKINGIILELEDKLRYTRQPKVAAPDALSIDEWKKLSDYAKERHIEISPLIQGLGHASYILKHPEYLALRDVPESDWAFNPLDSNTYEVQFDLYRDALKATPHGKYLHIGGDEVHTTGRNSGKSAMELQLIWLNKVCAFAEKNGRIPIFWDDMPLKEAEVWEPMFQPEMPQRAVDSIWERNEPKLLAFLDKFPKNCIYMRWNYSSPEALGNLKAMDWFRKHGLQVMGATAGQTRWVLMPLEESNMDNIKTFATNSITSGLKGLLLTLWDDDSPHFELYLRGIIAFAEYTWAGDAREKDLVKAAYRQREFSHALAENEKEFIDDLELPVAFWKNALLKGNRRNYLKSMERPMEEGVMDLPERSKKGEWSVAHADRIEQAAILLNTCDSLAVKIEMAKNTTMRNHFTLEVYEQVNQMARFAPKTLLALEAYDTSRTPEEEVAAVNTLKNLGSEFATLRANMEKVYSKSRKLTKPKDYILDQDHHHHLANQSQNFDWQFFAEMTFLEKLDNALKDEMFLENSLPLKQ